jgi:hypothetical protein
MSRIRTLEFLPSIFQTETNSQFLSATLDQLVNPPVTKTIQGYVGSKFGYGIDAKDYYVTEPNKVRRDYQLEPGVAFLKDNETTSYDFISYPGILDSLKLQGAITDNNDSLFNSQFYSWDSFTNLDMIINYNQYYWLPDGPPAVTVAASTVFTENQYIVTSLPSAYNIRAVGTGTGTNNPTITLLRGGRYTFLVDQATQFWIQGEPGVTGYSPVRTNVYTRDVYGVSNNGASEGAVVFEVPQKDAQNEYNYPGDNSVGVISTRPFSEINGARLSDIGGIDGVTALNGRTVMFYNTGVPNEEGYVSSFYSLNPYDRNTVSVRYPTGYNGIKTIIASDINTLGELSVNDTTDLVVGNTLTFEGISLGGIQPYNPDILSAISVSSMVSGKKYFIYELGNTDWIQAGVAKNAVVDAEIVGNELRVYNTVSGAFSIGNTLNGAGVINGTTITGYDLVASANNGVPTYTVSNPQTVARANIDVYAIQLGKIFTCDAPPSSNGLVVEYDPTIYYIKSINTSTNTITISQSLNGPTFQPSADDSGSMVAYINQGQYEEGYYTDVNNYFYTVTFIGDRNDPTLQLNPAGLIPIEQKITPQYGTDYIGLHFVKNVSGVIEQLPYLSAPLDTLYYQDGTNPNRVGVIKLIENNETNTIDVTNDILGKKNYTSKNGVTFTNGLKIAFDGDVIPRSYLQGEYYVQGVGTAIELIPVESLTIPEPFTTLTSNPYDILPYDEGTYDAALNIPTTPDYITIARNSINKNAWSRSNRWFHIDVINATADYNMNPAVLDLFATPTNKAKRPILEFYPNLKLFNSGVVGKAGVDFIDTRTTNAFDVVENQQNYYPDVETYTAYQGTINPNNIAVGLANLLIDQYYQITDLGNTSTTTWQELGAVLDQDGGFEIGVQYIITTVGTTDWNLIADTVGETYTLGSVLIAKNPGTGTGTGEALKTLFQATEGGIVNSDALEVGKSYTILTLGTTQWQLLGAGVSPYVGEVFVATSSGFGTGTAIQGSGQALPKTVTTVTIDSEYVTGNFSQGQWINDLILGEQSRLPTGTRILSISDTDPYVMTVYWPIPASVMSGTLASFVACSTDNTDQLLYPGARVVFANDVNELIRNKIYNVNFNLTGAESYPVITLTEAEDGLVIEGDMFSVNRGFNNRGKTFYFDGVDYVQAQQKQTINQAPLFDIFDENGISYGDTTVYNSSSFNGCKLFNYRIGVGVNDAILGFPVSFSSINNVGDISFEVSLYTQTFNYIDNGNSITSNVNKGFVYNYQDREVYERLIGWQTAAAPSTQYQVFQFNYVATDPEIIWQANKTTDFTFTVNVPQLNVEETVWPSLEVYNNNNILTLGTDYTVVNTSTSTIITVKLEKNIDTPIQVVILSDKISQDAYYTIPINLSNNPFNTDPTYVDIGDIRGHYQSIYENNPDTEGTMFGPNNYRDLGNLVPWGNRIIQNSASLVLPGAFLRDPRHNLYDALLFNSREYIKFKTLLVDTTNKLNIQQKYDPSEVLDLALDIITSVKSQEQSFFWSDMIPNKAPYINNTYTFSNQSAVSVFPLSKIYDFTSANYDGVLVYLQRKIDNVLVTKQLLKNSEYVVSTDSPSVTVTTFLETGDKIIVKEYNQTYGSYIPNTPSKLGLYPLFVPQVVLDNTYTEPTYFIQGHDGSYNKLYGDYNVALGMLVDFRDQVLLEFETRVYNNIKLDRTLPIDLAEIVPGFFRSTTLNYAEWTDIYSTNFLDWVGQNRLNYKTQLYNTNDPWTYNYREQSTLKLDGSKVLQGYWRGIYEYLYDTSTPNLTPWAMIGYANKPDWWESRYGAAPYTSNNLILWTDLQDGIDYNGGTPIVRPLYKRPGLSSVIPVDDQGNLREPLDAVIANYNTMTFQRDWRVGDDAPVEYSYRKSSTYPFDLMRLEALLKPAAFYNLGADLDNYKYNAEFNQFLVNGRTHLIPANIEIYGNGTAKTSYINWIVDYEKQLGVDATTNIKKLLTNLDVRLVYRLAGFSDKTLLKFFVEKGTPESRNSSLLIPDESYQILLYQNQAMTKLVYSGVVVQKMLNGYAVFGNSQTSAYFKTLRPILNGARSKIAVQDLSVLVANDYAPTQELVPYGTIFYTPQEVCQFLMNYGKWLEANGAVFDDQIQNVQVTWNQMCAEFLYWAQTGWVDGSILTLNPSAGKLTIDKESQVVQPLTYNQSNFVLNNNLYPIQNKDLSIFREGTRFSVTPLNEGDAVAYGQFNLSNIEHGIVFQNETLFNDTIYNLISGLKQNRIYVRGTKSGEWNGTLFASGFIYNQDNILEWNPELKYTKGAIVKYKNKFYTALKIVQPSQKFKEDEWKITDYDEIQKGLLPNSSTRSYESALYYNTDKANLEQDSDLLSFSLIGFRPREYMASADLTDITQVNIYKNLIKEKGTLNAVKAFKGANLPQGGIDYDVYENWAILQGTFGGTLNDNFVQFRLNESNITANPSIVGITDGNDVQGAQQLVPLYKLFNYGRPITDPNILPTADSESTDKLFTEAGYVNIDDVKMSAYFFSNMPTAVDKNREIVPINNLYVGDYVWLADYQASWQVLTPTSIGQVVLLRNNINGTCVVYFDREHNLNKFDIFSIINFDSAVNGYYVVADIVNTKQVLVTLTLPNGTKSISGLGIGMKFGSKRVGKPGDIQSLPLTDNEFVKNTVWVDEGMSGDWAVYRKNINYKYEKEFTRPTGQKFGSSVAYTTLSDYLFGDALEGKVYRYQFDVTDGEYQLDEVLTGVETFGTSIVHEQNVYAISQPKNTPQVFLYTVNDTKVSDNIIPYQTITASDINPSITNFGQAMALSGDLNWLFISDFNENIVSARNNVQVYRRRNDVITITDGVPSTALVTGATYQIQTVGTVNWTQLCADTIANEKDIYFIYDGTTVTGTGVAKRVDYQFITTITNSATTIDKFGHSLSTNYYGTTLTVGAPNRDELATNNGKGYIYDRLVQNYEIQDEYVSGESVDFTLAWSPNVGLPLTVTKNGVEVDPSDYSFVGSTFTYNGIYQIGDILTVSGNQFVLVQELSNTINPRNGTQYGYSVDNNTQATEILIGAPFYLSSRNQEGAAFRYTYGGARFGIISGTNDVNVTTTRTILVNGYLVTVSGNAVQVANSINNAVITNVRAAAVNGKLVISLVNFDLALSGQELLLSADSTTLNELGITLYTQTQVLEDPNIDGPSQFGTTIKFNEHNSVAISAPVDTRLAQTTFDFVDDENYQNDTIFDNNSTQFIDIFRNAGAVYTYEYLGNYNESLMNIGNYTYAQSVNAQNLTYGSQPKYGLALDWSEDKIIVGSPDYRPEDVDGQVVIYTNDTGENNWIVYRQPNPTIDINRVYNVQLFDGETNQTLQNLDYIDPLQGKLLGAVQQNIDVISNVDPANYNNINNPESMVWGEAQLGTIWFDTSNVRYINYHQNTNSYNARYWATLFPGSDVAVYSWVASNVLPSAYQGPGLPRDITNYTVQTVLNSSNTITPVYYFWVRNSGIVFSGKSLADINIANYITSPVSSGISYMAPVNTDAVALYNIKPYLNANDTVFQMGFSTGQQDNPAHQSFTLIRTDFADDFLPGVPGTRGYVTPESLYDRLLDSLSGVDETGAVVPNPFLPKAVQSGVLARPRQGFFYNRYTAIKNYLQYANTIMALFPISEIRTFNFLNEEGIYFDTKNYWEYVNWWAVGYDNNTKAVLQVPIYADLSALEVATGTIVTVAQNSNGSTETYIYDGDGVWTRIGLQNGTIRFKDELFDYEAAGYGFGGTFYDTDSFDVFPSEETRYIIRALNEQIYTSELLIYRNKSLILLFEYIQEETVENQNYLPWLNKTSLVDIEHKVRELVPLQNFVSDNEQFLEGYVNETKPYHVVIKEFLFDYKGGDVYPGILTDFDVPATYDSTIDKFVSPELVYQNANTDYEFLPDDPIWQTEKYKEWYNNYGLNLEGQLGYQIAKLDSFITLVSQNILVDNPQGFPINGTMIIGTEKISYASVDRNTGIISGLTRGVDGTEVVDHLPGELIYMDLPGVLILDGGRNYANPPRVVAQIDTTIYPAPRQEAVLEAVMSLDTVVAINVIDPGEGYVVQPEIVIDPAETFSFNSSNVNVINNTIDVYAPVLETGDLVRYVAGTTNVGGLADRQYYYINVLSSNPTTILALYTTFADALNDNNRVIFLNQGLGEQKFEYGARAVPVTSSYPIRENNITLRFDRTTYNSQVTDWSPNTFYGSEFVSYRLESASSDISLTSVQPDINNILSSAEGTVFPLASVNNDRQLDWSSFERTVGSITPDSELILSYDSSGSDENPSGSTIGFYVGMPVKFTGTTGSQIVPGTTYYINEIIGLDKFKISATETGSAIPLSPIPSADFKMFTAEVIDTAVITSIYSGYRTVTETSATNNIVNVSITDIGTNGTNGFYTNLPVFFTGDSIGGLEINKVYYVVSVLGNEQFTLSETMDPVTVKVIQTNAASQIIVQNTNGLNVNDPIVFDSININGEGSDTFGNIEKQKIYYIKTIGINVITISETLGGATFVTGVVAPADDTYCFITSQVDTKTLTTDTGNATLVVGLPVSPGQVDGQAFTFYPSSQNYADVPSTNFTYGNILTKTIAETLSGDNLIAIKDNLTGLYINIPFTVASNIGGLVTNKTYYAYDINNIEVVCKSTTSSTVEYTAELLADEMEITEITDGTGNIYPGTTVTGTDVQPNTYVIEQIFTEVNAGSFVVGKGYTITDLGDTDWDSISDPGSRSWTSFESPVVGDWFYSTGIGAGTGKADFGIQGKVGKYQISRDYPLPISVADGLSSTGVISLSNGFDTNALYVNMPIVFSLQSLGGVLLDYKYYVRHIIDGTRFTISTVEGDSSPSFTVASGIMEATGSGAMKAYLPVGELTSGDDYAIKSVGTTDWTSLGATYVAFGAASVVAGNYYIVKDVNLFTDSFWTTVTGTTLTDVQPNDILYAVNSDSMVSLQQGSAYLLDFTYNGAPQTGTGQATVALTNATGNVEWTQEITEDPVIDVGYILGGYNVIINDGGTGFTQNNTITIPGNVLGGTTPDNDLTLTVSRINSIVSGTYSWSLPIESNGAITKVIADGTPPGLARNYYLKVTGANSFEVYSDPLMQLPVSGIDFPYQGFTTTTITNVASTVITLDDATGFAVNDPIVFNDLDSGITLTLGQTYYVLTPPAGNNITVATSPGGTAVNAGSGVSGTATKPGSFILLPQPFVFSPSIVRYNNRVWVCTVSNNDDEFLFGKWQELRSDDRRLNALDRVVGYYQPTVNMPGMDLTQLFTGLTYPNATYRGNAFEPDKQYPIDTQLIDLPFDPTQINIPAVEWDGLNYIAPANLPNYAAVVADIEIQDQWLLSRLANQTLSLTDIVRGDDGTFVMSSTNKPTPLFKSADKTTWSVNGYLVPIRTPVEQIDFAKTRLIASGLEFSAVTHKDGMYWAAGKNIVSSTDASLWFERFRFPNTINRNIYDIAVIDTDSFSGVVAVGINLNQALILTSVDGDNWNRITGLNNRTLTGVTSAFNKIFVVGSNGGILSSTDGVVWTQLQPFPSQNYNAIKFANNTLVIVGDNGVVVTSTDGVNFTQVPTGTTENLNNLTYVDRRNQWTIVGDNNTVLQTYNITAPILVTWDTTSIFSTPAPEYTVQGDPFQAGYGPEELVPGIVSDQLTMIVNTRAGTNWPATEYAHVGYNVVSTLYDLDAITNEYSFNNIVQDPAQVAIFLVSNGISTTLYDVQDYSVDWINKTISLNQPLLVVGDQLRVDVYEVGNGDQLVKSSNYDEPMSLNATSGFTEIILDCDYNTVGYNTNGIVIPNTSGELYAEPAMYHNGTLLKSGLTNIALYTSSATHAITTYSTTGLAVDQPIVFGDDMFGGVTPRVTYYIYQILNATDFLIKDGSGDPVYLTNGAGNTVFVTYDYAVAVASNQINAKVIFAQNYDAETDYISYSFFGPTAPQYGYTIPVTQSFAGQNSVGPYTLTNALGGDNPQNAIVEVNGLRIRPSEYIVSFAHSSLTFDTLAPDTDSTIAVTTFNDSQRQYLFTTEYDTSAKQVTPIQNVNNTITLSEPTVRITTTIPHNLETNDIVRISGCDGAEQLNDHPPFIVEKVDDYTVKIFDYIEGIPLSASGPVNIVDAYLGSGYIWKTYTWILENNIATGSQDNKLLVSEVNGLIVDTPVYFTEDGKEPGDALSIPQLVYGETYYIKEVDEFTNEFTVTDIRNGNALVLTNVSGVNIRVTQWEQTNVDRLWVTVNGHRVASSNLRLYSANEVGILTEVLPDDEVVITSMMPSASPDAMTYIQIVDANGEGTVYRANSETNTWLTKSVGEFADTIEVADVTRVTNVITQTNTTPTAVLGYHVVGLEANRYDIAQVRVYNNNPARLGYIDADYTELRVTGLGPTIAIQSGNWIQAGDILTITTLEGRTLYVNGEYMTILSVDQEINLIQVQRGASGSIVNVHIPAHTTVYGLLEQNRMSQINYDITWNPVPGLYNVADGDPLQIAETNSARFLRTDIS